ncbi:MAG: hypothetical protein R3C11_22430 [Planctomycetaceae bacterium]
MWEQLSQFVWLAFVPFLLSLPLIRFGLQTPVWLKVQRSDIQVGYLHHHRHYDITEVVEVSQRELSDATSESLSLPMYQRMLFVDLIMSDGRKVTLKTSPIELEHLQRLLQSS